MESLLFVTDVVAARYARTRATKAEESGTVSLMGYFYFEFEFIFSDAKTIPLGVGLRCAWLPPKRGWVFGRSTEAQALLASAGARDAPKLPRHLRRRARSHLRYKVRTDPERDASCRGKRTATEG